MGYFRTNPPCELWRKLKCRLFAWFNSYAFGAFGKHNYLFDLELLNPQNIFLGSNLWISKTRLASLKGGKLIIGNHVAIGRFSQICALQSIIIEDGVLMAENTFISDNTHTFTDITTPVRDQDIKPLGNVVIGSGTWIGRNVVVNGCKIGRNCIIGAYTFLKKDIPDYCVVVGNPARIVKRYNPQSGQWEKTDKDGNFINE
ncbi:acyltransferase [Bacteroides uniformis]|uniref:acyltransferase n=1 Tax=Bacteroides uniformis TaxID=820 RepID=UPI003563C02F